MKKNGQLGVGAEVNFLKHFSAEDIDRYIWDEDKINFKASFGFFGQEVDLIDVEIKDVALNIIGKGIDDIRNGIDNIVKNISPEEKTKKVKMSGSIGKNIKNMKAFINVWLTIKF